jgi:hypothetical protein
MLLSRTSVAVLSAGLLALAGCGGTDGDENADATTTTAPVATATTAPQAVETATTTAPEQTVVVPPTSTVTKTATSPSGGVAPPVETVTQEAPPTTGGDQPSITVRSDGTARATAADAGQAEIWCDNARQGSYDAQLGDATTFVIGVAGSDQVTRCALPR